MQKYLAPRFTLGVFLNCHCGLAVAALATAYAKIFSPQFYWADFSEKTRELMRVKLITYFNYNSI